jgi:hypothetical protein
MYIQAAASAQTCKGGLVSPSSSTSSHMTPIPSIIVSPSIGHKQALHSSHKPFPQSVSPVCPQSHYPVGSPPPLSSPTPSPSARCKPQNNTTNSTITNHTSRCRLCSHCGKSYAHSSTLSKHIKKAHSCAREVNTSISCSMCRDR